MQPPSPRGPWSQDILNVRENRVLYDQPHLAQTWGGVYPSPEKHSTVEDDPDLHEHNNNGTDNNDGFFFLSTPDGTTDDRLVYSLHNFVATAEGQATVIKGDQLVLLDDSNSYWWLIRRIRTQVVGYIPAEHIETPFERLARFNRHCNVDLASPTQAEMRDALQESHDHVLNNISSRAGPEQPSVIFTPALQVHRYPPAVWGDDEEVDYDDEWDVGDNKDEDLSLAEEAVSTEQERRGCRDSDDDMSWEEALPDPSQQQQEAEQQTAQLHRQQQRQQIEEQCRQRYMMAQTMSRQAAATSTQGPDRPTIGHRGSRGQLFLPQGTSSVSPSSSSTSSRFMGPIGASETKKMSLTPLLVQDNSQRSQPPRQAPPRSTQSTGPMLLSEVRQQQEEESKRFREELRALQEAAHNKYKHLTDVRPQGGPAILLKELQCSDGDSSTEKDKKGEFGGLFGRLFDPRRDKHKEKGTNGSTDASRSVEASNSEESGRSSNHTDNTGDPQTLPRRGTALTSASPSVPQHSSSLREHNREHQMLYRQRDLSRSPASPPEVQPLIQISPANSGQGRIAPTSSPASDQPRARPESPLVGGNIDEDGTNLVPELSIIRVFAGKKLQTEGTFKTVLLNSSTSSEELVRQAIQRFRLPEGEDATDYCLIIKRIEGPSAVLHPEEKPLVVFETLSKAALDLPKLKRSSVSSISSIANNLSQLPAIKKLSMDDFTDDTTVRIYLIKGSESAPDEGGMMEGGTTINREFVLGDGEADGVRLSPRPHNISTVGVTVSSERVSDPSFCFALQLLIYTADLPDGMMFDPLTEAIVFKRTLRDRTQAAASSAPFHRRILMFSQDATIYEVINIGLEIFGVPDGVADGSREVNDQNTSRRGSSRVRYVLDILVNGKERELMPSDKIVDSYPRPLKYRPADHRFSNAKWRSNNSMQLLGSPDDLTPEDPVFILRRVIEPRTSSSPHLPSTLLDEIALQMLSEPAPSSSGTSHTDIPPHEAFFELHGNSVATQLELTMHLLSEFLPPSVTVVRTAELNGAFRESLRRVQSMLNEYLHMVKRRDDWWRARLVQEQRHRAVLEQRLRSVVQEGRVVERGLHSCLGRHIGIDSDIPDWEGLETIQARPPTLSLEEFGLGLQEHIQDTPLQTSETRQQPFVTDSTVVSGSLDAALTPSSFTTHPVVSPTSTSFMGTDPVNRDGARLLQSMSTSFTETALQDVPDPVVEVPAGIAISSEAPARSRRTRLSNYQQTRGKKFNLPALSSNVGDSVCSDDGVSTILDDESDSSQEFVDIDSVSDNSKRSIKTISRRSSSVQSEASTIHSGLSRRLVQDDDSPFMDFEYVDHSD